jgi:Kdo2-lipid IVA lauroyltransferase/acyltransferase
LFYLGLIFLKTLGYALSLFPRRLFLLLGRGLGRLLRAFGMREKVARENVDRAFPEWSAEERARFVEKSYGELGTLFLEMLRSFFKFDRFIERYADLENEHHLEEALAQGKGVFVMTAHLGNWEVLTAVGPTLLSTPVTMVTKELKPQWFHRAVEVTRALLGIKMACEPRTMQGILRALKKKEIVGFVMDQFTGAPVGARVPFFGVPVGSHTALATLAMRTGAPVVPAIAVRKPDGRYLIRFDAALATIDAGDQEQSVLANTAAYVARTEAWVREFPEQWMWIHRRWKGDLSSLPQGAIGEMLK